MNKQPEVRVLCAMQTGIGKFGGQYALISMCIGGGQGIAAIFKRV